ncbi:hypothetical protein M0804_006579 [Polistes exclamans]|nr:hypothetical protein M0804_006579 [Polistes exclamans]
MLLTDQYPGINSKEFKEFLNDKGISVVFTACSVLLSNSLNERLNETLINKIRFKINENGYSKAGTTIAHECVNKYNQTIHTVTGFLPSYLLYGSDFTIIPKELKQGKTYND